MPLYLLSLTGVLISAASGALAAGRKGFDLVGVMVIATVTALGGGTLRDLLLDRRVFWIADPANVWVAISASILTIAWVRFRRPPWTALLVADALGLALFTMTGTGIAQQLGAAPIVSVLMGTITGVAGGVLRDVLSAEVPLLFRRTETLYATAAIAGASSYLALESLGLEREIAALAGMLTVAGLRLAAIVWRLRLPAFELPAEAEDEHVNPS